MIQLICLGLLVILVVVRGPGALVSSSARPAWWATASGVIALSTYGVPIPFMAYDSFFGSSNTTTLIRDLAAISAFWFFREALARSAGGEGRYGSRWGLALMVTACTVPFFLIENRSPTETGFIINRLDQSAVWVYGSAYMATLIWISLSAIWLARYSWRGVHLIFMVGFGLVIVSCGIEISFLTASHFGYGGQDLRYSAWNASELPFFCGLLIIMLGIAWVAVIVPLRRRILIIQVRRIARLNNLIEPAIGNSFPEPSEKDVLSDVSDLVLLVEQAEQRGRFRPNYRETRVLERARQLCAPSLGFRPMVLRKAV